MLRKLHLPGLAIGTVLAASVGTVRAGLVSSFETANLDGWGNWDDTVTLSQDTVGATDGMYSLKVQRSAGDWNNTMELNPADVLKFQPPWNKLSFDVTAFLSDMPSKWLNVTPVLNSQSQGWQQGPDMKIILDGQPHTYTWDFSSLTVPAPGAGWFQLFMPSNSGDISTFYIDNIRTTTDALPGDANLDGKVDFTDLVALASNYGLDQGALWGQGDFNGDEKVDFSDLVILAGNYGKSSAAAFSAAVGVPEPTALSVLILGAASLLALGRVRCQGNREQT